MSLTSPAPAVPGPALEAAYHAHRDYVLAVLRRRCGWLQPDEREVAFHDAYMVLLEKRSAGDLDPERMHPREVRAYLTQTAIYKAMDEGKRAERKRAVPMTEEALAAPDEMRTPEELVAGVLDDARVREVVSELPERRQVIIKLRYFFDRTPTEIQRYLGISERAYRRELERAMRQVADGIELVQSGNFCDSRRSLILAYVAGIAGPTRVRQARAHLASCPGCAHWAATVRTTTAQAAALIPLPALARGDAGPIAQAVGVLGDVKDHVAQLGASAKNHALGLVARVDPGAAGYAASARPGAVAATVAGCLALGGGATYCAVDGLPGPVRGLVTADRASDQTKREQRPAPKRRAAAVPPQKVVTPSVTRTPRSTQAARSSSPTKRQTSAQQRKQARVERQRREVAAVSRELDPIGTRATVVPQTARTPTRSVPDTTGGEFDP